MDLYTFYKSLFRTLLHKALLCNGSWQWVFLPCWTAARQQLPGFKSKSHYDRRSVGKLVLVSCPFWHKWPEVTFIWVTITFIIFHVERLLWREDGSVIYSAMTQVQFKVTSRPTACRPVRLGARSPMGPEQIRVQIYIYLYLCSSIIGTFGSLLQFGKIGCFTRFVAYPITKIMLHR
jgi:hypothetical protein